MAFTMTIILYDNSEKIATKNHAFCLSKRKLEKSHRVFRLLVFIPSKVSANSLNNGLLVMKLVS